MAGILNRARAFVSGTGSGRHALPHWALGTFDGVGMSAKDWDLEVDWLVAGAGAAGMTGAVVANQMGGSVLVVEKEPVYGGTTAKSGGVIWIPGNHRQPEVQVQDSVEEGYAYLKGLIGDSVSDARIKE